MKPILILCVFVAFEVPQWVNFKLNLRQGRTPICSLNFAASICSSVSANQREKSDMYDGHWHARPWEMALLFCMCAVWTSQPKCLRLHFAHSLTPLRGLERRNHGNRFAMTIRSQGLHLPSEARTVYVSWLNDLSHGTHLKGEVSLLCSP